MRSAGVVYGMLGLVLASCSWLSATPESAGLVEHEVIVRSPERDIRWVRASLPESWSDRPGSVVLADGSGTLVASLQFDLVCGKDCTGADVAGIDARIDEFFDRSARPDPGTGDPSLPLEVTVLDSGDIPDGKFRVGRLTRPPGSTGPHGDEVRAICVRGRAGEHVITAQAWLPAEREAELGAELIAACKAFEVVR